MTKKLTCKYAEFSNHELSVFLGGLDDGSQFEKLEDETTSRRLQLEIKKELKERKVTLRGNGNQT